MDDNFQAKWYVLQVMSGQEKRVYNLLKNEMDFEQAPAIKDLQVPVDRFEKRGKDGKLMVDKDGKPKFIERNRYPGYILIKVHVLDENDKLIPEVWEQIKAVQGVIGFVGAREKPTEIPESEVIMMLQGNGESEKPRPRIPFKVGDCVLLKGSAFIGYEGVIENINENRGRLKVAVNMLGHSIPVEIGIDEVDLKPQDGKGAEQDAVEMA